MIIYVNIIQNIKNNSKSIFHWEENKLQMEEFSVRIMWQL